MNIIHKLNQSQSINNASWLQKLINNGQAWHMEGAVGRAAMDALRSGACYLPKKSFTDAYGNKVPSRDELQSGTMGTIQNSIKYYNL